MFSYSERGQLVHTAMEYFWRQVRTSQALRTHQSQGTLQETIRHAAQAAIMHLCPTWPSGLEIQFAQLEQQRLETLLHAWLQHEANRLADFEVTWIEEKRTVTLTGPNGTAMSLTLRVDRSDYLPDTDRMAIIDYKTGTLKGEPWLDERPKDVQIPLYATVFADGAAPSDTNPDGATRLGAALLANVRSHAHTFHGVAENSPLTPEERGNPVTALPTPEWQQQLARWKQLVGLLTGEFLAGDVRIDPIEGGCMQCGLEPLCRYGETASSTSPSMEPV
jgi:hypothetical protein